MSSKQDMKPCLITPSRPHPWSIWKILFISCNDFKLRTEKKTCKEFWYEIWFKFPKSYYCYCSENPPIVVQGGGGIETPPPWVFVLWQYCETILFSVESLLSSLKDTNNGCHLAHRLGFHQELEVKLKPRNGDFCWAWHET